jgi:carbon-monoxide dehydrogenase small subunit
LSNRHSFEVNGERQEVEVPPMKRLLDVLREDLRLTGTKYGCGEGECGACTVLLDGEAVMSCLVPIAQADGCTVETVEGLAGPDGSLSKLQESFLACGGAQCGICTPGILMSVCAHLRAGGSTATEPLREALAGNICRCTGYVRIYESIQRLKDTEE